MQNTLKEFLYVSNLVSLSRALLAVPIAYLISLNTPAGNKVLILLVLAAVATDILDGYLGRRLDQRTELGRILDPLADKVVMGVVLVFLVLYREFPLSLVALLIYRDIIIVVLGTIASKRTGRVVKVSLLGKANTAVVAGTAMLFLFGVSGGYLKAAIVASHVMIWTSGLAYYVTTAPVLFESRLPRTVLGLCIIVGGALVVAIS